MASGCCKYRCGCLWSNRGGCAHHGEVASALPVYDCSIREPCVNVGRRRALLQRYFWEQCASDVFCNIPSPPCCNDYCTEYIGRYVIPGFQPSIYPTGDCPEHKMYPLYHDTARTFWRDHIGQPSISQFKRNSSFTTPLDKILDAQFA